MKQGLEWFIINNREVSLENTFPEVAICFIPAEQSIQNPLFAALSGLPLSAALKRCHVMLFCLFNMPFLLVLLDTFDNNLCLWHCTALYKGVWPDQSTQVQRYFKLGITPNNIAKTSLDQLDKIERHLNQELLLADWQGNRVYALEHQENGEILWYLFTAPFRQAEEHNYDLNLRRSHIFYQRYQQTSKVYAWVNCQSMFNKKL